MVRYSNTLARSFALVLGTFLLAIPSLAQPPADPPPSNAPTSFVSVYSAKIPGALGTPTDELEQTVREHGTLEYVEFVTSHGPEWHVDRKILRMGTMENAYPGFTLTVQKGRQKARAEGRLNAMPGRAGQERVNFPGKPYEMIQREPQSPTAPGRSTIRKNGAITGAYVVEPASNHGRGKRWPGTVRLEVPDRDYVIVQFYE